MIIAEARFACVDIHETHPEIAAVVDDKYQNSGIATYMLTMLMQEAQKRSFKGFKGYILAKNKRIMRVLEKIDWTLNATLNDGVYAVVIDFN